ncbi:MAG: DUF4335 domain-containing protein [Leptolyngbyaceae bacterium]|nr:DUF4335 domain-containing protein [Leptolyngbyaceae bacterium]
MTIQRQYSLPNCRLVLEGWGDGASASSDFMEGRPVMTILTNAECHFSGQEKPLSGDREFLENLIVSVNQYAQQMLSGVTHPIGQKSGAAPLIHLSQTDPSHHRLTMQGAQTNGKAASSDASGENQMVLSTVQLFDLVEAIDQMIADAQTLPDLYLDLTPVPKRGAVSQEPVTSRIIPAALGVSGLAIAAIALFFIPVPEFEITEPEIQTEESLENGLTPGVEPGSTPDSTGQDPEEPADSSLSETPSSDASLPDEASTDEAGTEGADTDIPSQEEIEELFTTATPIADSDQLDDLTAELRETIVDAWNQPATFEENLEYRVGVSEDGQIVGYRYANDAALTYANDIPLGDLTVFPSLDSLSEDAPIAQFRVVFLPSGVVEVSPWYGRLGDDGDS